MAKELGPHELDDIQFRAEEFDRLTPIDYARLRGIKPQNLYYHLRNGNIESEWCPCGRRVLSVEKTDKALGLNQPPSEE